MTLYPTGCSPPLGSTINFGAGQTRANNAHPRARPERQLERLLWDPSGTAQFVLDLNGYSE